MEAKSLWRIILDFLIYLLSKIVKKEDKDVRDQKDHLNHIQNDINTENDKINQELIVKNEETKKSDIDELKDRLNNRF